MVIRQQASKSLKFLMGSFQVVLFLNKYCKKQDPLIKIIENRVGDVFDAIYTRCSYKNDNRVIDYSQIYDDFGILHDEIEDKVAVLWPVNLEAEEVKDREREELLFVDETLNYPYKNIITECIPVNTKGSRNPLAILFTAMSGNAYKATSFSKLTKAINLMMNAYEKEKSENSWSKSDGDSEDDEFSFLKGFKALQKLVTQNNIPSLKWALFSTSKVTQAVDRQKFKEYTVKKFRETKEKTYKTQFEREEMHKK